MIYALGDKVRNGYYYDKSRWIDFSREKKELLLQNKNLQDPIEKITQNFKTNFFSEQFTTQLSFVEKNFIYKTLIYYLNFFQI